MFHSRPISLPAESNRKQLLQTALGSPQRMLKENIGSERAATAAKQIKADATVMAVLSEVRGFFVFIFFTLKEEH